MARFPAGNIISVLNHLVSEEVLLGFSTNFFRQTDPDWIPEVKIDVPRAVSRADLNRAIKQILETAGRGEDDMIITTKRWDE
jgi:hypothetical protein